MLKLLNWPSAEKSLLVAITIISILCYPNVVPVHAVEDSPIMTNEISPTLPNDMKNYESERIDDPVKWYSFLDSFHEKLSEYENWKRAVARKDLTKLENYDLVNEQNLVRIHRDTSKLHLTELVQQLEIPQYDYLNEKQMTILQKKELIHVLGLTFTNKIEIKCIGPNKIIRGKYISLKDIVNKNYLKNDCPRSSTGPKGSVAIFALNTLFIDENVRLHGERLIFISPKWEVIDHHEIDLSGGDAGNLTTSNRCDTMLGKSGDPGLPGRSGGVFFGIGETFKNGGNLNIRSYGGKGGVGRDGCPGVNGIDGNPASFNFDRDCKSCQSDKCAVCECFQNFGLDYLKNTIRLTSVAEFYLIHAKICTHEIIGQPGEEGSKGGNGGRGGKGGNHGYIVLLEFGETSNIKKLIKFGPDGDNGLGGKGGIGGQHGDNLVAGCDYNFAIHPCRVRDFVKVKVTASSGPEGISGANAEDIKDPSRVEPIYNPSEIISEYKSFIRENLIDYYFGSSTMIKFLKHLDNDERIGSLYDLLGFFDDLERLEKQFYELNIVESRVPLYQSLLDRINKYSRTIAEKVKDPYELENYQMSLKYLYTAIAQRIHDLKLDFHSYSITNIEDYLSSLKIDVNNLKYFEAEKNKIDIVQERRKKYKMDFEQKIEEAKKLIDHDINGEIKEINQEIDSDITKLVKKVASQIKQGESDEKKLEEAKKQLENTLTMRGIFHTIEFIGKSVSLLGPYGSFVGGVIQNVNNIAEQRYFSKGNVDFSSISKITKKLLPHVKQGNSIVSSLMKDKINNFKKILDHASKEISDNKKEFGDESLNKISSIKEKLSKINPNNFNYLEVRSLENEFNQDLGFMKDRVKNDPSGVKEITASHRVEKLVDTCKFLLDFGQGASDLIDKFNADSKELDVATNAIVAAQYNINGLKKYQDSIYNEISPLIHGVQGQINELQNKLASQSKVALDVTKWKVQITLKDIKAQIYGLTKGHVMPEHFNESIDKLESALSTLITVYNDLQAYQSEEDLAGFIADVSSAQLNTISLTTDMDLRNAIEKTEILIRSNLIMKEYNVSIHAFEQFVFPFAHLYLSQIELPRSFHLTKDVKSLAENVIDRIDFMTAKLKKYKNSHTIFDKSFGLGEFNSLGETTQPFFVWKNEHHKGHIKKLLAGKEVLLNANIEKFEVDVDAVKFKELSL